MTRAWILFDSFVKPAKLTTRYEKPSSQRGKANWHCGSVLRLMVQIVLILI